MGQNLIDKHQCAGSEEAVQSRLVSIADQWEFLTHKTAEKSMKLKEANKQRTYIAAVKDLDFWLGEVESLLTSEDAGKDLASVQNLMKKHQLVDADILVFIVQYSSFAISNTNFHVLFFTRPMKIALKIWTIKPIPWSKADSLTLQPFK